MSFINKIFNKKKKTSHLELVKAPDSLEVKEYYEKETSLYLESYGDIIQAARPTSGNDYLDYLIENMGITDGMKLLDAGCGVCGPSIYFAKKKDIRIDAITLAEKQVELSKEKISAASLKERVFVQQGDFHFMDKQFTSESFDMVFFLESLGYSKNTKEVLSSALSVIKPGGFIYIKDFFPVPLTKKEHLSKQLEITKEIRQEYCYRLLDLVDLISITRELGFFLVFIKRLDFIEDFTNAANFEAQNGYKSYTKAITNPYQLYEPLQLKFQKLET